MDMIMQILDQMFGVGSSLLLALPLVIAMCVVVIYPFTGENGSARAIAFTIMGLLPVMLYLSLFGTAYPIIPFGWLTLLWAMTLFIKLDDKQKERNKAKEENKKLEAKTIVKRLSKKIKE